MGLLKAIIKETEKVTLDKPTTRQIIDNGLETAKRQGDARKVAFWERSKAALEKSEEGR